MREHQIQPGYAAKPLRRPQHIRAVFGGGAVNDGGDAAVQQRLLPVAPGRGGRNGNNSITPGVLQRRDLLVGGIGPVAGRDKLAVGRRDPGGLRRVVQRKEADFVPRALHDRIHAVRNAVAVPAGGAVKYGGGLVVQQVGGKRGAAAHVGIADKAGRAVGKVVQRHCLQVIPGRREGRQHIHAAGQAGALGAVQGIARIQQDRIRGGGLQRGGVRQRGAVSPQPRRGKNRDRDVPHPHKAGAALGAVGQRGRDRTLAAVGAGADRAVFVHRGNALIACCPVDPAAARLLVRLVRLKGGVGVLAVHVQLIGAGIVLQHRRGSLSVAGAHAGKCKRPHDEIKIHRLALHAVVRAGGAVGGLPHVVGAGIAQLVREAGDPEVVAPRVKPGVTEPRAHPVQRGIDALLTGVAMLLQAVEERFGDLGHLGRENAADVFVLQIIVDGVAQPVRAGGVVVQPLLRGRSQAQQPRHMVGLAAGLLHRCRVGVEIGAERDAQPGTFVGIAPPLRVILRPVFLSAVPLTAEAAADDRKVDTGRLGGLPVDLSLKFGDIHALQHRRRNRPAAGVEVVAQFVFLPCGGRRAEVSLGRAAGLRRAAHHHNGHHQHDRQAEQTQPQHNTAAAAFCTAALWFLGRLRRARRRRLDRSGFGGSASGAAVDFAFFWHGGLPLSG